MLKSSSQKNEGEFPLWVKYWFLLVGDFNYGTGHQTFIQLVLVFQFLFKKYLEYEKSCGDEERIESVKRKAMEYVESSLS